MIPAVVLAGGRGTRLWPLTKDIPKPMVLVSGKPFLYWQMLYLSQQGVRDVTLLIAHLGEVIQSYFAENPLPELKLTFVTEPEPLGTGGALRHARPNLPPEFLVINGDSFAPVDLPAFYQAVGDRRAGMTCLTKPELVPVPANVNLRDGLITQFEKGAGKAKGLGAVDAGVYFFRRELIEQGPSQRFDLEMYWPELIAAKELGAYPITQRFFDIGTVERLKDFEEHRHDYF